MWVTLKTAEPALQAEMTVGYEVCANCHRSEAGVWKSTWHNTSFRTLHRAEEAKEIASRLGLNSIKYSERCIKCHYTPIELSGQQSVNAAVSCECCHGAAKSWYMNHFPPQGTSQTETPEARSDRIVRNVYNGMRNRHNTYSMSRKCMRCHNIADEELVNIGGHSSGTQEFEMVSWSQGLMRHRFVSGGGQNAPNSNERLSIMFVSGIIADLEFSLRATANATQNAKFGKDSALRAHRALKRLRAIQSRVDLPVLEDILQLISAKELKLNNKSQLVSAADEIQILGVRFGAMTTGEQLNNIQEFVPKAEQWRWE